MTRLEDAEKRLHDAISSLERALATRAEADAQAADRAAAAEAALKGRIADAEAERDAMEKRMSTAAVRMDATIERLRGVLKD